MTLTPERLALTAPPPAAGELDELVPAAALCLVPWSPPAPAPRSDRVHYISAAIAAAVELVDLAVWLALRPISAGTAYVLLYVATLAGAVLVGAAGMLSAVPSRKAQR